jgi:hypothetical protein
MESDWLDSTEIEKMLDGARAGRPERLSTWLRESRLRCASPDYSSLVLVREHKVSRVDRVRWGDLNCPPEPGDPWAQFINLLRYSVTGGFSWSKVQMPDARRIIEAYWQHGRYTFLIASDLTFQQIVPGLLHERILGTAAPGLGLTGAAIADNFVKIFPGLDSANWRSRIPPADHVAPADLPRTIEHRVLGVLTRDEARRSRSFHTTMVASGRRLRVVVEADWKGSCERALRRAEAIIGRLDDYVAKAKRHAASAFLDLKNDFWLAEDEHPISSEEFQGLMQLSALEFGARGGVEFTFADGESADRSGLFLGHWIVVTMRGYQFTRVEIEG